MSPLGGIGAPQPRGGNVQDSHRLRVAIEGLPQDVRAQVLNPDGSVNLEALLKLAGSQYKEIEELGAQGSFDAGKTIGTYTPRADDVSPADRFRAMLIASIGGKDPTTVGVLDEVLRSAAGRDYLARQGLGVGVPQDRYDAEVRAREDAEKTRNAATTRANTLGRRLAEYGEITPEIAKTLSDAVKTLEAGNDELEARVAALSKERDGLKRQVDGNEAALITARTDAIESFLKPIVGDLYDGKKSPQDNLAVYVGRERERAREAILGRIFGAHYKQGAALDVMLGKLVDDRVAPINAAHEVSQKRLTVYSNRLLKELAAYKGVKPEDVLKLQADLERLTASLGAAEKIVADSVGKIYTQVQYGAVEARANAAEQARDAAEGRVKELEGQVHPDYNDVVAARDAANARAEELQAIINGQGEVVPKARYDQDILNANLRAEDAEAARASAAAEALTANEARRTAEQDAAYARDEVDTIRGTLDGVQRAAATQADKVQRELQGLRVEYQRVQTELQEAGSQRDKAILDLTDARDNIEASLRGEYKGTPKEVDDMRERLGLAEKTAEDRRVKVDSLEARLRNLEESQKSIVAKAEQSAAQLLQRFTVQQVWQTFGSYAAELVDAGRYDEAIPFYEAVLAKETDNAGAKFALGRALKAKELVNAQVVDDTILQSLSSDTYNVKELLPIIAIAHRREYMRMLVGGNTDAAEQYKANAARLDPTKGRDDYLWKPFDEVALAQINNKDMTPEQANREYMDFIGKVLACGDRFLRGITTSEKRGFTTRDLLVEYLVRGGDKARADMTTYRDAFKLKRGTD